MNCATGDKFTGRRWRDYTIFNGRPFTVGNIVGVLLDLNEGQITFYKDGVSLGLAFEIDLNKFPDDKLLFPFVQMSDEIKLSIFHPFVYPM